jgi:hypothetical protein
MDDEQASSEPQCADLEYLGRLAGQQREMQIVFGRRIALRAVLDALDEGATIRQIIDACAIIEPESKT